MIGASTTRTRWRRPGATPCEIYAVFFPLVQVCTDDDVFFFWENHNEETPPLAVGRRADGGGNETV